MKMVTNLIVGVQIVTFGALAVLFFRASQPTLATAQMCYAVATAVLFLGKA